MEIVRPVIIASPISGQPVAPRVTERRYGQHIYREAVWTDPASGAFIRKGVVQIIDAVTGKDVTHEVANA
jgi:hypothetical protein